MSSSEDKIESAKSLLGASDDNLLPHSTSGVICSMIFCALICLVAKYFEQIRVMDLIISNQAMKVKENQINRFFTI